MKVFSIYPLFFIAIKANSIHGGSSIVFTQVIDTLNTKNETQKRSFILLMKKTKDIKLLYFI